MLSTLRISFSLKNTYRVNSILYSLKQIPLVKLLLPATIYQAKGLKIFANVLSLLWELVTIFLYKWLYFFTMVVGIGLLYEKNGAGRGLFAHFTLFDLDRRLPQHRHFQPHQGQILRHDPAAHERKKLHPGKLRLYPLQICGRLSP